VYSWNSRTCAREICAFGDVLRSCCASLDTTAAPLNSDRGAVAADIYRQR
jgi:hypothetical protein